MTLDALLRRQGGVLSLRQARALGLSDRTVERRVAARAWHRLHPGVYLVAGHPLDTRGRVRAAALWVEPHGTVSGPAAAFWHRMLDDLGPPTVDLTLPRRLHRAARPGVRVRRRDLHPADRVRVRDLAVTARPLTVLETAAVLPDGAAFLDRALQRHVGFDDVHAAYSRMLGARGSARAGVLLRAAADRADSHAERLLLRILRGAGLGGWVVAHPFAGWTLDVAFPDLRLAIELDGWAWHVDRPRFANDRAKQNAVVAAGWTVLRFTWSDVADHPDRTLAVLRRTLARAA